MHVLEKQLDRLVVTVDTVTPVRLLLLTCCTDVIVLWRPTDYDHFPAQQEINNTMFTTDWPALVAPPGLHGDFGRYVAIA